VVCSPMKQIHILDSSLEGERQISNDIASIHSLSEWTNNSATHTLKRVSSDMEEPSTPIKSSTNENICQSTEGGSIEEVV
jgi:hypothetical protein